MADALTSTVVTPGVLTPAVLDHVAGLLASADFVLVAAGAGMSIDAGFDYGDESQFVRRYPRMAARGPRCRYQMFGYPWPSEAVQWGHLARHLEELRFSPPPTRAPYDDLRELTARPSRFVLTSNADDLFERTGFAADRLWTRQGSYALLQCLEPCRDDAYWPSEPWVKAALPKVDPHTEELVDPALIPRCPHCGGPAMMCVRGGDWFLETPFEAQAERFSRWAAEAARGRLVVLDVGTGFNTPGVVRWAVEGLVHRHRDADLVRVNPFHPQVPPQLGARAIGLATAGAPLWSGLKRRAA